MGGRGVGAPHATLPLMPAPLIWHITEQSCWDEAVARGTYTHSTRDRDLSDEGYIHASWPEQISPVARRVYPDRPDHLVILEIDVAALERAGVTVAIEHGVWLRPFRNLIYVMPPFICTPAEVAQITSAMIEVARALT